MTSSRGLIVLLFILLESIPSLIRMRSGDDEEIISNICTYSNEHEVKEIMKEYLKRLILAKPDDPVAFLIESIENDPFVAHNTSGSPSSEGRLHQRKQQQKQK